MAGFRGLQKDSYTDDKEPQESPSEVFRQMNNKHWIPFFRSRKMKTQQKWPMKGMQSLLKKYKSLFKDMKKASRSGDLFKMDLIFYQIISLNDALSISGSAWRDYLAKKPIKKDGYRFVTGTFFLRHCQTLLTVGKAESLYFITGVDHGNAFGLDHVVNVKMEEQSKFFVRFNDTEARDTLIDMDEEYGHYLRGIFHSHRGKGESICRPSSIDLDTQKRYEQGGYKVLSAVFTDDGFIRFFTVKMKFHINIIGKGVENHGHNLYRLTEFGSVQSPAPKALASHGSGCQ